MFKAAKLMFIYTDGSVHPGAGDSTGVVDLPIQREVHTELPIIQGSELKGALREYFERKKGQDSDEIKQIFGTAPENNDEGAGGAIGLSMARVVLFPLASLKGVFAWVTCPMCLEILRRDLSSVNKDLISDTGLDNIPTIPDSKTALTPEGAEDPIASGKIFLSEFPFKNQPSQNLNKIAEWLSDRFPSDYIYFKNKLFKKNGDKIQSNFVLISDNIFKELLKIKTEIVHRNVINKNTGTSDNLWTEENIPGDTLMYSMIYAAAPYNKSQTIKTVGDVVGFFEKEQIKSFILGGNQTVGRGWVSVTFV